MMRQAAPVYITNKNKGDLDKHCRALLDSLTKSAFADDSQVVSLHAVKKYCETESETGANIKIRTINETDFTWIKCPKCKEYTDQKVIRSESNSLQKTRYFKT